MSIKILTLASVICIFSSSAIAISNNDIILRIDLKDLKPGLYYKKNFNKQWNNPKWNCGIDAGRIKVIETAQKKVLEVFFPKNTFGPQNGGSNWKYELKKSYNELYLSYKVKFQKDFNFVKGGKLPGLFGGENIFGKRPNGHDGWNAMMMWREDGLIVQYLYHPDQLDIWGDDLVWRIEGKAQYFIPDTWYTVEHRIVMNTPKNNDGILQCWLNGELALDIRDLRYRDTPNLKIDSLYFSTFFGGNDSSWATQKDEKIFFDDIIISTKPITH